MKPETHYARSGGVNIAYQVVGDGPRDLVYVPGWVSNIEVAWDEPHMAAYLNRLASFSRLIMFDKRGTGLSDRVAASDMPTLETRMDDVRATAHHAAVREQLGRFRGREIDTAGDGFLAAFDGPARGVRAACAAVDAVRRLGLDIRAAVHTGECEVMGSKLGGIAVHIGARVSGLAKGGEVLVSGTVRDLVAGSGLQFEDRGAQTLKGVPGEWRLYAVDRSARTIREERP